MIVLVIRKDADSVVLRVKEEFELTATDSSQKKIVVIGAGMVGASTAWHLRKQGAEVILLDRKGVAAGSSWGNAGWLAPALTMPLAESALWGYMAKSILDPNAPLHIPVRFDVKLWNFLLRFITHATDKSWMKTMKQLVPLNKMALPSYDEMIKAGVKAETFPKDFLIAFKNSKDVKGFIHEMDNVRKAGLEVNIEKLDDPQTVISQLSKNIAEVYALRDQRFIAPGPFVQAIVDSFVKAGGTTEFGKEVADIVDTSDGVEMLFTDGSKIAADAAVLATGAWLPKLAKKFGVKEPVQAGRGYSFSVAASPEIKNPVYFPAQRVACTPYQGRFRIAGTMEFLRPDEPLKPKRIRAIINSVKDLFTGLDLEDRQDEWVGSRPVSTDGLALIGATKNPKVFVGGGHGMWGVVLGPVTGKLLSEQILTGKVAKELEPYNPLR